MTEQAKKLKVKLGGGSKLREKEAVAHGESYNEEDSRYMGYQYRNMNTIDVGLGGNDVVNIQTLSPT